MSKAWLWLDVDEKRCRLRGVGPFAPEDRLVLVEFPDGWEGEPVDDLMRRFIATADEQGVDVPDAVRGLF